MVWEASVSNHSVEVIFKLLYLRLVQTFIIHCVKSSKIENSLICCVLRVH